MEYWKGKKKWYKHQLEPIKAKGVTIFWDTAMQTDRKIENNRLDIVITAIIKEKHAC